MGAQTLAALITARSTYSVSRDRYWRTFGGVEAAADSNIKQHLILPLSHNFVRGN